MRGIPLGPDQDFFENLINATKQTWPRPKIVIISYPHNPTTEVVDLEFFEKIVDYAREHNILVIHDFAYADLVYEGYQAPSMLQVEGAMVIAALDFRVLPRRLQDRRGMLQRAHAPLPQNL